MPNTIQEPTVGRIVHYFVTGSKVPFPAMVQAAVPGALTIPNLHVYEHDGTRVHEDVPHVSEASAWDTGCWDWMAYQKGQAAKAEKLEDEIAAMVKSVGKSADQSVPALARSPKPE